MTYFNNFYTAPKAQSNQGVNKNAVLNSIQNAARKTGVNFSYLMEQAAAESNFNPTAKAKTSSAQGLFQFLDSTWLGMVKNHGDKHGMGHLAQHIEKDANGRYTVANPAKRAEILNARNNPDKASVMAAEFAKSNERYLKQHVPNVEIGKTELYLAHFLGANGAARFLNAMKSNPEATASQVFKKEAKANHNVFFDAQSKKPRSLEQVYAFFDKKFDTDINIQPSKTKEIQVAKIPQPVPQQSGFVMDDGTPLFFGKRALPSASEKTIVSSANGLGYTRQVNAETLFLIQKMTNEMERIAFGDMFNNSRSKTQNFV